MFNNKPALKQNIRNTTVSLFMLLLMRPLGKTLSATDT